MTERVILKLDGILDRGCRIVVELWLERECQIVFTGKLPPNPELANLANLHWQKYRAIGTPSSRLKPESIEIEGSINNRMQECRQSSEKLGDCFRQWLNSPEFLPVDRGLRDELSRHKPVRVFIETDNTQLQKLPWHLWDWSESRKAEVALSYPTAYRLSQLTNPLPKTPHVRILAILGHRAGIDIEADRQILENLPDAEVLFLVEPTRQELSDTLWEKSWDILFFAGHSETEGEKGRIYLNPDDSLTLDELRYGLRQAVKRGLQLAVFNSCDGLGLAQQLGDLKIPQMVVMREVVGDKVAQTFLKYFLTAFSGGKPFELAVRQAREQLQGLEDKLPCASWLPAIVAHPQAELLTWNRLRARPPLLISQRNWQHVLQIAAAVTLALMGVRAIGWLQPWELNAYDLLMRMRPAEVSDPRLLVVEATEADVNRYSFPLPDGILAQAIEKVQQHQPRVIAVDIFRHRPNAQLGQLFQKTPNLISLCSVGQADNPDNPGIPAPPNVPENRQGFSDVWIDPDGVLRRFVLFMQSDYQEACATRFSFASLAALFYLQAEGIEPKTLSSDRIQLGKAILTRLPPDAGGYRDLDNRGFQVMLNYRNAPQVAQHVRIADLLDGKIPPDAIQNRIVIMGVTATISNASGFFETPYTQWGQFDREMPGVIVQAHAISQLIGAALDDRSLPEAWNPWVEAFWIGGWAVLGGAIAFSCRRTWVWGLVMGATTGSLVWVSLGLFVGGQWVPLIPAAVALVMTGTMARSFPKEKR
jgi:CHASE2 domain-containing sensor protein